jgi:hypothetical protein
MGVLGFDSRPGLGIFLFTAASRTALGSTQPPLQWVAGALSLEVNWPGREADHSPPSSAEVKNAWSYTSTPQYAFMAWCLVKHRDNFTFTFYTYENDVRNLQILFNFLKVTKAWRGIYWSLTETRLYIHVKVFWIVTPYNIEVVYERHSLHPQDGRQQGSPGRVYPTATLHGVTTQKTSSS